MICCGSNILIFLINISLFSVNCVILLNISTFKNLLSFKSFIGFILYILVINNLFSKLYLLCSFKFLNLRNKEYIGL